MTSDAKSPGKMMEGVADAARANGEMASRLMQAIAAAQQELMARHAEEVNATLAELSDASRRILAAGDVMALSEAQRAYAETAARRGFAHMQAIMDALSAVNARAMAAAGEAVKRAASASRNARDF